VSRIARRAAASQPNQASPKVFPGCVDGPGGPHSAGSRLRPGRRLSPLLAQELHRSTEVDDQRRHEQIDFVVQPPRRRTGHIFTEQGAARLFVVVLPVVASPDMFYVNSMLERLKSSETTLLNKLF
jgi:hypothetical protein